MATTTIPAFGAAIAYIDPGNVATNLTAGATTGYLLAWVVVAASVVAVFVQFQAAKLGIATGRSLPELCRERFPRWGNRLLWAQAEIVVIATDLAEFVGAAIGLKLVFGAGTSNVVNSRAWPPWCWWAPACSTPCALSNTSRAPTCCAG